MHKKLFYNSLAFRVAAPPLFGIVFYLLILMFFDSVEMLANNFFSREVLFSICLTILFFELNRMVVLIMNRGFKNSDKLVLRVGLQYLFSFIITIVGVSISLYLYFVNIEGFSTIKTELITFNSIYIFAATFYHLYFFSMLFLFKRNDELYNAEQLNRDSLELELNAYKNQINPEFLFQTLEIIIGQFHHDKKKADELIDQLARVYRYTLDNQNNELIGIDEEIKSLESVLFIFITKYPNALKINKQINNYEDLYLVPGTLQILFEYAVISNLVSKNMPLTFIIQSKNNKLLIHYKLNERITKDLSSEFRIEHLKKTYNFLSPDGFQSYRNNGVQYYEIPLLKVEEE